MAKKLNVVVSSIMVVVSASLTGIATASSHPRAILAQKRRPVQ